MKNLYASDTKQLLEERPRDVTGGEFLPEYEAHKKNSIMRRKRVIPKYESLFGPPMLIDSAMEQNICTSEQASPIKAEPPCRRDISCVSDIVFVEKSSRIMQKKQQNSQVLTVKILKLKSCAEETKITQETMARYSSSIILQNKYRFCASDCKEGTVLTYKK